MNPSEPDGALLRRLLQAADAKAADLASHLHPDWVKAAWQHAGALAARQARRVPPQRQSALLAQIYGLRWPALADLQAPAHRLALLSRAPLLRVLATCALYPRRERVRRSIGRDVRHALLDAIGETAYRQLLDSPAPGLANPQPLSARDLDPERLAAAGYRALCAQGAWTCRSALALTRMSLAPDVLDNAGAAPSSTSRDAGGADAALQRLPDFFPELAWLFGSDMDRALSA